MRRTMSEQRVIHITRQVQGVNFRPSAQRLAGQIGLTGYARNQPDGSVLIVAEGSTEALDELIAWCKVGGPPRATVDKVEVSPGVPAGYQHFTTG